MAAASPAHVLVVDDEPDLRTLYELTLLREGYRVEAASTLGEACALLEQQRFDAVITDMRLPDGLGLELLQRMSSQQRPERCVVMTAYGSAENAVEALKAGAFDYLTKPVDLKQFRTVVASAIQETGTPERRVAGAARGSAPAGERTGGHGALMRLVGDSAPMRLVKERIGKVARSMAPVLVRGESGTGKELVARAIHACSHRAGGPFVAVNCSAIPETLLEAEFFGAKKGSYTGATADREGFFQAAQGGTLFLDEIGDLPLAMQSKLLRAIQERSVRALGSTTEESVDVRVVSATHKDLAADVQAGRFRQDLFYRLNVIEILVPPLRERREDLPMLCEALLSRIAQETGMPAPQLSPHVVAQLQAHPLPGNVRELENLLHRALALSDGSQLQVDFAPTTCAAPLPMGESVPAAAPQAAAAAAEVPSDLQAYLDQQEREILVKALRETNFNRTAAAQRLGLSLRQIRYRIARLAIATPGNDEPDEPHTA
ncbi:sigma-54-dependent Fis family transcriptional regulator [Ramlibacter sp. USB13]|uniref:Sigma-54-dependent Fis family transcriptional regulator n=1 Tax=Ramlibacter cellulosilyticus TaxID=2764187 RepID=A0A923SCR0_9BURK|nr:sigma-54 dependent transcriptional regulator [Ramlibacter cellulosilyticus]MBC5785154.1 sigma-54-dependent Fis family transcriptional regulator [Ramlibacter cellulosilyticus]